MSTSIVLVLVIAGVLVLAGIGLIVLAVMLGRQRPAAPELPTTAPPTGARGPTFIDEPLQTDFSSDLGEQPESGQDGPPGEATAGADQKATLPSPPPAEGISAPNAATRSDRGPRWGQQLVPEGIRAGGVGPRKASYEFRVELGFRSLAAGQFTRTVGEFERAIALTDDPDAKAELFMEIGNASRMAGDLPAARAAYEEAITYSHDPLVWEHLRDWIEHLGSDEPTAEADDAAAEPVDAEVTQPMPQISEADGPKEADVEHEPAPADGDDDEERGA